MKNFKKVLNLSIVLVAMATIATFSSISYAKYIENKSVGQTIGKEQKVVSIFFNAYIWRYDNPNFYMWVNSTLISPTSHINPTIAGVKMDLYVFEFNLAWSKSTINFIRANPDISIQSLTTWPESAVWNQTNNITYNSDINYYCIVTWNNADNSHSRYTYNRIDKDDGGYSWGNPTGSNTEVWH